MRRLALVILVVSASIAWAGKSVTVTSAEYGSRWPLKVSRATLECREAHEIVLIANGKTYWFNGLAKGAARLHGWANLEDIWLDDPDFGIPGAKKDIHPLDERAQQLCGI